MPQCAHSSDLRKGRHSESGRVYLVTTVARGRNPMFADLINARILVRVLRHEQDIGRARTLCYVVMPDHLHWLVQLGDETNLSSVVGDVKSVSAHLLGGRIWQPGFHDHAVRKEEDLLAIARYVVANPVRKGLVRRLGDYPHWDALWL